jgi:hypothetical protein
MIRGVHIEPKGLVQSFAVLGAFLDCLTTFIGLSVQAVHEANIVLAGIVLPNTGPWGVWLWFPVESLALILLVRFSWPHIQVLKNGIVDESLKVKVMSVLAFWGGYAAIWNIGNTILGLVQAAGH